MHTLSPAFIFHFLFREICSLIEKVPSIPSTQKLRKTPTILKKMSPQEQTATHVPSTPPFCCTSNPIPQSSPHSLLVSTFLLALHALSPISAGASPKPSNSKLASASASSTLFRAYPSDSPLPDILILLQTIHFTAARGRPCTQQYFAQLPDRNHDDLHMWPEESFGLVEEKRVEELWQMGENWQRRDDLGNDAETGRIGWKCQGCGRQYWVRIVKFEV